MKTQYTKGPWRTGNLDATAIVDDDGNAIIATHIRNPHDARLIAAAPELLAALELVRDTAHPIATRNGGEKIYGFDMNAVLSAIAKAKGE